MAMDNKLIAQLKLKDTPLMRNIEAARKNAENVKKFLGCK